MDLEESLDKLSNIIKKSKSNKLKKAFTEYLLCLNTSMKDYCTFMELVGSKPKVKSIWDVELINE